MLVRQVVQRKLLVPLGLIAFCGLAAGVVPGKWKVPDGGKKISQRPAGMNWVIVTNTGPESITLTSKGLMTTKTSVIAPSGTPTAFSVPANAKNVVIRDQVSGTNAGAKGFLYWAKKGLTGGSGGDPGGAGS